MKDKIVYLEFLRIFCAIVVILDHICIAGIHIWGTHASTFDQFFYNGVQHWSHFAVPVFLMISGYLLLAPQRKIDYKKAITKYVWRIVVVLLTVGTAFAWMEIYFKTKSFVPSDLLLALWNTIQGDTWKHLWYLYTLVGLYLVLPVLKPIFEKMAGRDLDIFLGISFFFGSIMPTLSSLAGFKLGVTFPMCSIYLFYFMIGRRIGVLETDCTKNRYFNISVFGVLSCVSFICAYFEYYKNQDIVGCLTTYSSPVIVLAGISFFYMIRSLDSCLIKCYYMGGNKLIKHLSLNSFGIYVFHMLWVNVLYKVIKFNPFDYGLWILLPMLIALLVASDITTSIFRKVPFVGKFI